MAVGIGEHMPRRCQEIIFSGHAVQRMFQRGIGTPDIMAVIEHGEIIAEYPEDFPFPSYLLLGWLKNRPIHVVVAVNHENQQCYIITAYIPDKKQWNQDFKTRSKP
jgi:hypothetical protein